MVLQTVNLSELSPRDRLALKEWALEQKRKVDFTEFCCAVDPNAERGYRAPHLRKIAESRERVESGECKRLFITAPPRHWKPVDENSLVLMGDGSRKRLAEINALDVVIT